MSKGNDPRLGVWLMIAATFVFSLQDGISRHLASEYNVYMVVMIRYWFFAAFVVALAHRQAGGVRAAARTSQPFVQTLRALLLVVEVCVMITDQNGPVQIGDLLTTSDKPGHAMKAGSAEESFGAVIGKALASHETGDGMIPMVIALQ